VATSKPGPIHERIVAVMQRFPEGVTGGQIRQELGLRPDEQTHLEKRKRELKAWFVIEKVAAKRTLDGREQRVVLYKYIGRKSHVVDEGQVSQAVRAEVIHAAHGQCRMCGETVETHGITLVVDHKKPRDWGGTNDRDNLWAICEPCNAGKKAFFSSVSADPAMMKRIMASESVHVRIGELLKAVGVGKRTPSSLLQIVADQEDWQKRLRELRYPVIGWDIETKTYKAASGRKQSDYILRAFRKWPDHPTAVIREFEKKRERQNRGEGD
jgi:5-methylcytosine-specific restriction endonuclease McrA